MLNGKTFDAGTRSRHQRNDRF